MFIRMPNQYTVFLDNGIQNSSDRIALVEKNVLDFTLLDGSSTWESYFNDAWLRESSNFGVTTNKVSDILERAATFILGRNSMSGNIITEEKQKKVSEKEIPLSCTSPNVENMMYGAFADDGDIVGILPTDELNSGEVKKDVYFMSAKEVHDSKKNARKSKKKWKNSKTYKLNKLYSTPVIKTYRVKPVKNDDGTYAKDTKGRLVLDVIYVETGGHKGIFDAPTKFKNVPDHNAKWCIVDTENIFTFCDKKYRIDDKVKQYAVDRKTNAADMDRILCYCLNGQTYFFDENIDQIDNNMIKEVAKD